MTNQTAQENPPTQDTRRALYDMGIAPCHGCEEDCLVGAAAELGYCYPAAICPFPPGSSDHPLWPREEQAT